MAANGIDKPEIQKTEKNSRVYNFPTSQKGTNFTTEVSSALREESSFYDPYLGFAKTILELHCDSTTIA